MAQVDRTSNVITNATATPITPNIPAIGASGQIFEVAGLVTPAADDSSSSIHRFVRVPSNARVSQVLLSCLLASSAGAVDVGVYQTAANGGAVVDADFFASAQAITTPDKSNLDVTYESGVFTHTKSMQPLWQALGLSSDPCRDYDIATTITTTFNGGPTAMTLKVRYVI